MARLEAIDGELGRQQDTVKKIRMAIEAAGVDFIDENGGELGARLRKRMSKRPK